MAGRWPTMSRSRASAASSKRIQRLRVEHGDGLEGVVEAKRSLAGCLDRHLIAGREVFGKLEPFVAAVPLGDEAVAGLAVGARVQGDVAGVAEGDGVAVLRGVEFGEEGDRCGHGE